MNELLRVREAVVEAVNKRTQTVVFSGLDKKFCRPDGNWNLGDPANDYDERYLKLRDCAIEEISNTILSLSPCYSGYQSDAHQAYVDLLLKSGVLAKSVSTVLEIGAGYGALAVALLQILGKPVNYIICDIPESLLFSGLYLAVADHNVRVVNYDPFSIKAGVTLIPNYRFQQLVRLLGKVDLVINTLSMSEMSEHQVRTYAESISKLIGTHGAFFEWNQDNRHLVRKNIERRINGNDPMFNATDGADVTLINCKEYLPEYFSTVRQIDDEGRCHLWSNG